MANYGIKVARQGYDVKTCADNELLFSSSFKMLLTLFSGSYLMGGTNPDFTHDQTIFTHNLNFYPVVIFYMKYQGSSEFHLATNPGSRANNPGLFITTTTLFYQANSQFQNVNYNYFIMNVDLEADYTAPAINTSATTQTTISNDYGFKASKDGIDVKTANMKDLAAFSGSSLAGYPVRNQIIHKIGGVVNLANGNTATIAHGLGYAPMFITYRRYDTGPNHYWYSDFQEYDTSGSPTQINIRIRIYADSTNLYIINNSGNTTSWRYVIFKDPLF